MEHELAALFERYVRHGDVDALEQVFDRAAPELLRIALHLAPDAAQAEDLVQATFVRALENAGRFEPERALLPWLIGILAHEAARARRDGGRAIDAGRLAERTSLDPAEESATREVSGQLVAAVRALPVPYRDVIAPHVLEGERAVDIARKLDRAPGTVRMQILRGLELLRKALPPSLATGALLASGVRGHAAVRAAVRARASELAPALARSAPHGARPLARLIERTFPAKLAVGLGLPVALVGAFALLGSRPATPTGAPASRAAGAATARAILRSGGDTDPARVPQPMSAQAALPAPKHARVGATELAGRVIDADGQPAPGARVTLWRCEAQSFEFLDLATAHANELVGETFAEADGGFHLALERGLGVHVRAELGAVLETDSPNRFAGQFVELRLSPGHLVEGRVTSPDGAPVAGARVRVFRLGGQTPTLERATTSAADGSYELRVPFTDGATLEATHDALGRAHWIAVRFAADGSAHEDVVFAQGTTVVGRVVDDATGDPIAGATIADEWTFGRTATSDANGAFRLESCDPHTCLHARAAGYGKAMSCAPEPQPDGSVRFELRLRPGRVAVGRIVDASAEPVADTYVAAVGYESHDDWIATRTDADGRFALEPLATELGHALLVKRHGFANAVFDFPADEAGRPTLDLGQITLRGPALVAGRVVDGAGNPVADAAVTLTGWNVDRFVLCGGDASYPKGGPYVREREATSDEDGRFWFGEVSPGHYTLLAVQTGRRESPLLDVVVQEGDERDDLELAFPTGLSIRGVVRDSLGNALAGAHVCATADDPGGGSWLPTARAGADGSFEIEGLAEGTYEIESSMLFVRDDTPGAPWLTSWVEHVAAGGEPLAITVERGTTIEGVVRDAEGRPSPGCCVSAAPYEARIPIQTTDALGRFRLAVPSNALWTLDVVDANGQHGTGASNVASGTHDLELTVP